jgi:hypothetical protein
MTEVDGKDFWTAESFFGEEAVRNLLRGIRIKITEGMELPHSDEEYKEQCCGQCQRLWVAHICGGEPGKDCRGASDNGTRLDSRRASGGK